MVSADPGKRSRPCGHWYRSADGRWLVLARSAPVHVPPYILVTGLRINSSLLTSMKLRGKTFLELVPPAKRMAATALLVRTQATPFTTNFWHGSGAEAERVAGSLFGSSKYPFTNRQSAPTYFPLAWVGSAYHVWSDHVRCGNVRCFLCLDATTIRPRQFW